MKTDKTILELMCIVSEKMKTVDRLGRNGISLDKTGRAASEILALMRRLELSQMQVLILTALVAHSSRPRMDSDDIAEYLGMDYLKFLTYTRELEGLMEAGYILLGPEGQIYIENEAIRSLRKDSRPEKPKMEDLTTADILSRLRHILTMLRAEVISADDALDAIRLLLDMNPETSLTRCYRKRIEYIIPREEQMIVFTLLYHYYYEGDEKVDWPEISDYFSNEQYGAFLGLYHNEQLAVQRKWVIEYAFDSGVQSKDFFRLTDAVLEEMLADVGGMRKREAGVPSSRKIAVSTILPKRLYYNPDEARQVARLKELLSEPRFTEVCKAMKERGMRTGFTCLFHGGPGTGKTETVYQLARSCRRDLFVVDVARVKSCWVGESEKNISQVFAQYRRCLQGGGRTPILLFNEADAILGVRQEGALRGSERMENSIQNILLQNLEDFDGILIATTNLAQNLDRAFERRFLYKLRFEKPSLEARSMIWREMMPGMTKDAALQLAEGYSFSGGQIENVARKSAIASILGGKEPSLAEIRSFCEEETLGDLDKKPIGFRQSLQ